MQLVLCNNRVLTYGENFISLGGIVINTATGRKYENATIAECDCVPNDIDSVGYEYHCGDFVPCAPFGKGTGNIAVLCDGDCKSIKDSGMSIADIKWTETITYTGYEQLQFSKLPKLVFISGKNSNSDYYGGIVFVEAGHCINWTGSISSGTIKFGTITVNENTINVSANDNLNRNITYTATAIL